MKRYSKHGYKRNSKDKNRPYNIIDSGRITMKDVDFPVMGVDNLGNSKIMMPGGEYIFPGNEVFEVPLAQNGLDLSGQLDPVEINTEGMRRPLRVYPNPIPSDYVLENPELDPMSLTPRNYITDRIEYWTDPNSLAKERFEAEPTDDFILPKDYYDDKEEVLSRIKPYEQDEDFYEARNLFVPSLSNIAFIDMTPNQKKAHNLLLQWQEENPGVDYLDMLDYPEKYGYEDTSAMFADNPILNRMRWLFYDDPEASPSSSASTLKVGKEQYEDHRTLMAILDRDEQFQLGDRVNEKSIREALVRAGEDPDDPKWDNVLGLITMNPDMHEISDNVYDTESDYNTTLAHEIGHIGRGDFLSERDEQILDIFNRSGYNLDEYDGAISKDKEPTDHHWDSEEAYVDITAIRQDMLDKGIYDYRTEQMTSEHWNEYLDSYGDQPYPLVLQRTIERYRVPDNENPDKNIQYINNTVADAEEIEDDINMGYAQDGGERTTALRNFIYDKKRNKPFAQNGGQLKKFQPGGQVIGGQFRTNAEIAEMVESGLIRYNPEGLFTTGEMYVYTNPFDDPTYSGYHQNATGYTYVENGEVVGYITYEEMQEAAEKLGIYQQPIDNPNQAVITQGDPVEWERQRKIQEQREYMAQNRIPPNMMWMVYAAPGLTDMYNHAQRTGDFSIINQQVAAWNPANPDNLLQGAMLTLPLPLLNRVRLGKVQVPGLVDDVIAPATSAAYANVKTFVPGIKGLDEIIAAANANPKVYTPETMFYRNMDGTVGIRPNVPRPPKISKEQWNHLQTLEWDISQLRKINPQINTSSILGIDDVAKVIDDINPASRKIKALESAKTPSAADKALTSVSAQSLYQPVSLNTRTFDFGSDYVNKENMRSLSQTSANIPNQSLRFDFETNSILMKPVAKNSLQLKSLQDPKGIQTKKDGTVNINTLQSWIKKQSKGDQIYLNRVLSDPKYKDKNVIPFYEFSADVSNSIIPLDRVVNTGNLDKSLGYPNDRYVDYYYNNIYDDQFYGNIKPITMSFQNKTELGYGDTHLGEDDAIGKYNLGWIRGNFFKENPELFTLNEIQSNWAANVSENKYSSELHPSEKAFMSGDVDAINATMRRQGMAVTTARNQVEKYTQMIEDIKNGIPTDISSLEVYKNQLSEKPGWVIGTEDSNVSQTYTYDKMFADSELIPAAKTAQVTAELSLLLQSSQKHYDTMVSDYKVLESSNQNKDLKKILSEKNALTKRMFGETVLYAAENGATTFRFPTVGTAAKFQGWSRQEIADYEDLIKNKENALGYLGGQFARSLRLYGTRLHVGDLKHEIEGAGGARYFMPLKNEYVVLDENGVPLRSQSEEHIIMDDNVYVTNDAYTDGVSKMLADHQKKLDNYMDTRKSQKEEFGIGSLNYTDTEIAEANRLMYTLYQKNPDLLTGRKTRKEISGDSVPILGNEGQSTGLTGIVEPTVDRGAGWNQPYREEVYQMEEQLGRTLNEDEFFKIMDKYTTVQGDGIYGGTTQFVKFYQPGARFGKTPTHDDELKLYNDYYFLSKRPERDLKDFNLETDMSAANIKALQERELMETFYQQPLIQVPKQGGGYETVDDDGLNEYFKSLQERTIDPNDPTIYKGQEPIANRYKSMPKYARNLFGNDLQLKKVTDAYGNEWWEFDIPQSVYDGQYMLPPHKLGGQVYQEGGETSYIKGSSNDPNIYPDKEFNWYNPMDWYRYSKSGDPKEILQNARSEGFEAWFNVLPDHLKNTNYYNLKGAFDAGLDPIWIDDQEEYHMQSRDPETGKLFKYEDHPTFNLLVQGETDQGNIIWYDDSGQFYSGKPEIYQEDGVPEGMHAFDEYSDQYFMDYLQFVENSYKRGYDMHRGVWIPFKGEDSKGKKEKFYTVGYGHTLSKDEYKQYKKGVSQEKVDEWLQEDIDEAQRKLDTRYGEEYWYQNLHPREKAILLDIEYNVRGGMNSFPKLKEALETGNKTLLLTEFWRDFPGGKDNQRNQEFLKRFVRPVSNMYKYNKKQRGGEIQQDKKWNNKRERLHQQLKKYQEGGSISPFAMEELQSLGLVEAARVDNTRVVMPETPVDFMSLTPKSSDDQEYDGRLFSAGATYVDNEDDDEEEEEEENNEEENNEENEENEEGNDEGTEENDEEDEDEEDEDKGKEPNVVEVDPVETKSYNVDDGPYGDFDYYDPQDDEDDDNDYYSSFPSGNEPNPQPSNLDVSNFNFEYRVPIAQDFTSDILAREISGSNFGEAPQRLTFEDLQVRYGDFNPARMQQAQRGGDRPLPNVIMNENSPQLYSHRENIIYVNPEDVEGPEIPYVSEYEPDHVLRHELEHYYQHRDITDTTPMAPAALDYDIMTNTSYYPAMRSDDPMSDRLIEDRELVMRDLYLNVLDPDGTNFWLQNMDIEDLMDEMALDNEAIPQLERQVMNYPVHIRDYMLSRIRGERASRLYLQATEDVYYDPRTLEGQARMIEDDGRQDAHIIETLKHQAIKNKEEGISEHPYIKKEMKTLQKDK